MHGLPFLKLGLILSHCLYPFHFLNKLRRVLPYLFLKQKKSKISILLYFQCSSTVTREACMTRVFASLNLLVSSLRNLKEGLDSLSIRLQIVKLLSPCKFLLSLIASMHKFLANSRKFLYCMIPVYSDMVDMTVIAHLILSRPRPEIVNRGSRQPPHTHEELFP